MKRGPRVPSYLVSVGAQYLVVRTTLLLLAQAFSVIVLSEHPTNSSKTKLRPVKKILTPDLTWQLGAITATIQRDNPARQ